MIPGVEMRVRPADRLGVAAVTYVLFGVKLGPALALFVVLVFAIWIGWRWLCRNIQQSPLVFRAYQGAAARSPLAHARARAVGVFREDAYRQMKSRLELRVADLGPQNLKNIAEPVHAYLLPQGARAAVNSRKSAEKVIGKRRPARRCLPGGPRY
jgi:hypothetical protein